MEECKSLDEVELELQKKFNRRVHGMNLEEIEQEDEVLLSIRSCEFFPEQAQTPAPYRKPGTESERTTLGKISKNEFYVWDGLRMESM